MSSNDITIEKAFFKEDEGIHLYRYSVKETGKEIHGFSASLRTRTLLFLALIILLFSACTDEKTELKKSNYDIKQCNKETYSNKDLEEYNQLIEDGEIQGYNCVGLYYMREKDYKKAKEYFNKGKDKGNIESYTQLGSLYSNFLNNKEKAIEYYTIAANNGEAKAAHNLGVIYDKRFAYKEALKWYEKSFNAGDTYSLLAMGTIYLNQNNLKKAIDTFEKVGDLGDSKGYYNLGILYRKIKR
ncbi:tetratricopeptide repeat protein [Halarcobacter anaerophilus]|uniref:tetratricopeptide repeat protein n=1 Tax=Halarcobacter anaerophilus TaxID=877500 RepID=UPI0005C9B3DE|nr:tetratricopeptide repeat protein [Halarcobacter anaerophilus]